MTFHFGTVLFNNPSTDILRLFRSVDVACRHANVDYSLSFLRNSNEPLRVPDEVRFHSRIINFSENLGFGQGHNKIAFSLEASSGFYVGLNPDGFLSPWSIAAALSSWPISGNLYEFRQEPQEHPKTFDPVSGHTEWSSAAAFLIELAFFRKLGGFDPSFFLYCEDVDLSWRVREQGGACIMMANATFSHDVSDNRQSPNTVALMLAAQALLARKWNSRAAFKTAEERLRKTERRYNLTKTRIPKIPRTSIRKVTPDFCDFNHSGSYSITRW